MGKAPVRTALEALATGRWHEFVRAASRVKIETWEDAVRAAIDAIVSGTGMVLDDIKDLGRLDRPHHWLWGIILASTGIFLLFILILGGEKWKKSGKK